MRYSKSDVIDELVHELLRDGWVIVRGGRHWKLQHPNGHMQPVPGTPSDRRAELNFVAQIRRAERNDFRARKRGTPGA